ncbi:MAG: hypothetical protein H6746_07340 [Deltaproteobacteria bacterium]|nr:hypothetical protein [Deltaproteobacteria bacterium]
MALRSGLVRPALLNAAVFLALAAVGPLPACTGSSIGDPCSDTAPCDEGGLCIDGRCFANVDGGPIPDIGRPDTVADTATDAEPDTTPDTATDTATDAEPDTAADAEPDTATDAEPDTATDAEPDSDSDAGTDTIEPFCGDQIVQGDEACDDGNDDDTDLCHNNCTLACGDGVLQTFEVCDTAIAPDAEGGCPLDCATDLSCSVAVLTGTACEATCVTEPLSDCVSGDGCCGDGCDAISDEDCAPVCGNEVIEEGETCDPPSSCPTSCDDGDPCTTEALSGNVDDCDVACVPTPVTACESGDSCCPEGCVFATDGDCEDTCGDGFLDEGELCDPCPASCDDEDPCTTDVPSGSASTCDLACAHLPVTTATSGDGCCPEGANANSDTDCPSKCDNGEVEPGETCDPCAPCPTDDACTTWSMTGSASGCDLVCTAITISVCGGDPDGCCPAGCDSTSDSDCTSVCGNEILEQGETCDPPNSCPTNCNDDDVCTADLLTGQASKCTGKCLNTPIVTAADGDGCCPPGANANTDTDCASDCGNEILEPGELCDPCTEGCDDQDACTTDTVSGSADNCDLACTHTAVSACSATSDGCCPSGCSAGDDADCAPATISPLSAVDTSGQCLTAGTGARAVVSVELVDTAGEPVLGATVTMTTSAGSLGSVAAEGNLYYAELTAPDASVAQATVTVVAGGVTLDTKPVLDIGAPLAGTALSAGGWGGCPADHNARVRVVDPAGQPLAGARVMVGAEPLTTLQTSFLGAADGPNHGTTDAQGYVRLFDLGASLSQPLTVTAAAEGREYLTVFDVDASDFVLALPVMVDTTPTGTLAGDLTNVPAPSGGSIELGIVFPDLAIETLATFNLNALLADSDCYNAGGIAGSLAVPGNVFIPAQCALAIGVCLQNLPKHPYKSAQLPYGSRRITGLRGAAPLSAITGGVASALPALTLNGIGVVQKTINAPGPTAQNIGISVDLSANVTCAITNAPTNADVFCITAGDWDSKTSASIGPGEGQLLVSGFKVGDAAGKSGTWNITGTTSFPLSGVFADVQPLGAAVALYLEDSKSGIPTGTGSGQSAILDRSGAAFGAGGGTMQFQNFLPIRTISRAGRVFTLGALAANGHPAPHYVRGLIQQRVSQDYQACSANDSTRRTLRPLWEVYTPGDATGWTLPTVPASWPRAAAGGPLAGLIDPAATAESDIIQWQALTVYEGLTPNASYDQRELLDFRRHLTHVSTNAQTY